MMSLVATLVAGHFALGTTEDTTSSSTTLKENKKKKGEKTLGQNDQSKAATSRRVSQEKEVLQQWKGS